MTDAVKTDAVMTVVSDSEHDSDQDGSVFTDCASGTDGATGPRKRRQMSMSEILLGQKPGQKKGLKPGHKRARRSLHGGRSSQSPRDSAKRQRPESGESDQVHLSEATLKAIQNLIEAGNSRVISAFEAKFAH